MWRTYDGATEHIVIRYFHHNQRSDIVSVSYTSLKRVSGADGTFGAGVGGPWKADRISESQHVQTAKGGSRATPRLAHNLYLVALYLLRSLSRHLVFLCSSWELCLHAMSP